MVRARYACALLIACWMVNACAELSAAEPADVRLTIRTIQAAQDEIIAVEAGPFPANALARFERRPDGGDELARVLQVSVDDASAAETAIVGSYAIHGSVVRFTPRFPFVAGQAYRAVLHASELLGSSAGDNREAVYRFRVPVEDSSPPAQVTAIFPSSGVLPENQLRFYIHFSAPMARGNAYAHLQLLDSQDRAVDLPFLEIGEELWDPRQQRLTLLIDPGRIKRGVLPREKLGPVLKAGEQFTLVVKASWLDAQNRPLKADFVKRFRVSPPIEQAIDPGQWHILAPTADSLEPLTIELRRPLDHALLQRLIEVRSASGDPIEGQVLVSCHEQRWQLRPKSAWSAGRFEIVVDRTLEDLAGNRIGRAFEIDQAGPTTAQIPADVTHLRFEIAPRR